MPTHKILGFFDFHILADKTRDFFVANDFSPADVVISKVEKGQQFYLTPDEENLSEPEKSDSRSAAESEPHHHTIGQFFKKLFHDENKPQTEEKHVVADRDGFILTIVPATDEQAQIAKETLHRYRANYIQEFND